MNIEEFRDFCLSLPHTEECTPFDEMTLVYKIGGRMYAFAEMTKFEFVVVKCDPDRAVELRERYGGVRPAYHMNKRHWNSVYTNGSLTDTQLRAYIRDSYQAVQRKLPRAVREALALDL